MKIRLTAPPAPLDSADMRNTIVFFLIAFTVLRSGSAFGEELSEVDQFYRDNLGGWDGVVLTCTTFGNEQAGEEICKHVETTFRFLAETAGTKYASCVVCDSFGSHMAAHNEGIDPALFMNFTVGITQSPNFEMAGGLLWMSVEGDYQRAACIDRQSCSYNQNIRGDIVFYVRNAVFSGRDNEELKSSFVSAADRFAKEFLTIYSRAKRQAD